MTWDVEDAPHDSTHFLGVDYETFLSDISGVKEVKWLGRPRPFTLPVYGVKPGQQADRPKAYWVPAERADVIAKLQRHGIRVEIQPQAKTLTAEMTRLTDYKLANEAYEGRVRLTVKAVKSEMQNRTFAAGSARVSTDQPLGDLAMLMLEPLSTASLLQWGYFNEILQRTEYIEGYVIEPLAQRMLQTGAKLKAAFAIALQDTAFAKDPDARRRWFYARSPYYDAEYLLYPVGREK